MTTKLTLSKSKINTFIECPRKFKYRYIDEISEEANEYMLLGTEVHEIAEDIAGELMDGNEIDDVFLNLEYDEKLVAQHLERAWNGEILQGHLFQWL